MFGYYNSVTGVANRCSAVLFPDAVRRKDAAAQESGIRGEYNDGVHRRKTYTGSGRGRKVQRQPQAIRPHNDHNSQGRAKKRKRLCENAAQSF